MKRNYTKIRFFIGFKSSVLVLIGLLVFISCNNATEKENKKPDLATEMKKHGGVIVTIDFKMDEFILSISNNPTDSILLKALAEASYQTEIQTGKDFIEVFGKSYKSFNANGGKLANLFMTPSNQDMVTITTSDADVLKYISQEYESAIDNSMGVLEKRLQQYDIKVFEIKPAENSKGRVLVTIPGIKNSDLKNIDVLSQSAVLEFWETYKFEEFVDYLFDVNDEISKIIEQENNHTEVSSALFERLVPEIGDYKIYEGGSVIGYAKKGDIESVTVDLNRESIKRLLPKDIVFVWSFKPLKSQPDYYELYSLKKSRDAGAVLGGDAIVDAKSNYGQNQSGEVEMTMNESGAALWARITKENIDKSIAIVVDGKVYSAPTVRDQIKGGKCVISGDFTLEQATDLANILKSGPLMPAEIVDVLVVEPVK